MRKRFRIIITTLLSISLLVIPVTVIADHNSDTVEELSHRPNAEQMIVDGLIFRPLSLAGTIIGTGIFIVTLPFSIIGGNVQDAGKTLIVEPAQATFNRCLGCLPYTY